MKPGYTGLRRIAYATVYSFKGLGSAAVFISLLMTAFVWSVVVLERFR